MEKRKEISQFRIIQETYHDVTIILVESKDYNVPHVEVQTKIQEELESLFQKTDINYHFEWRDVIPFDENGKLRMLISKV